MDERRMERLVGRVSADAETLEEMRKEATEAIACAREVLARSRRLRRQIAARRAGPERGRTGPPAGP